MTKKINNNKKTGDTLTANEWNELADAVNVIGGEIEDIYKVPEGGIPKEDLNEEIQNSLDKANTALQEHQDVSGKVDKPSDTPTINDFMSFDENGNALDSGYNADSFAPKANAMPLPTEQDGGKILGYEAPTEGANPVVGWIEKPSNGITPYIDQTTKHWMIGEEDTEIDAEGKSAYQIYVASVPRGETPMTESQWLASLKGEKGDNAISPFKGWLDDTSDLPANPHVGDYAYVKNNGTTYVYRCIDEGLWPSNSDEEKEPSDATFASAQLLNNVKIDYTHLSNPVGSDETNNPTLAKAEDVMQLKAKLEGVTASESKATPTSTGTVGKYIKPDNTEGDGSGWQWGVFNVVGCKCVRFIALNYIASTNPASGWLFLDDSDIIKGGYTYTHTAELTTTEELVISVPEGATKFKTNIAGNVLTGNFYCYLQSGESVKDLIDRSEESVKDLIDNTNSRIDDLTVYSEFQLDKYIRNGYVNNSNKLTSSSSYKCALIPASNFESGKIKVIAQESVGTTIAFIKALTSTSTSGVYDVTYCDDTHKYDVNAGETRFFDVPNDAEYIYIWTYTDYNSQDLDKTPDFFGFESDTETAIDNAVNVVDKKIDVVQDILFESLKTNFDVSHDNRHLYMSQNGSPQYWSSSGYYHYQIPLEGVFSVAIETAFKSKYNRYIFVSDVDDIASGNLVHYFNNTVEVHKMPEKGVYNVEIPEAESGGETIRPAYLIVYAGNDTYDYIKSISIVTTKSKDNSENNYSSVSLLDKVKSENDSLILANPVTEKHLDVFQKKVQQMVNIQWTPNGDIPMAVDGLYESGHTYTGIPYSGNNGRSVGFGISLETFMTAVHNPYSLMYTEDLANQSSPWGDGVRYNRTNNSCRCWYGTYCNSFAQYVSGHKLPLNCSGAIQLYVDTFGKKVPQLVHNPERIRILTRNTIQKGDILTSGGDKHTRIVYDVTRDGNGNVTSIKIAESTSLKKLPLKEGLEVNLATDRTCVITEYRMDSNSTLTYYIAKLINQGFKLCRNNMLFNDWLYEPSPFVYLEGETAEINGTPSYNEDVCTFGGDKVAFLQGDTVVINFNTANSNNWSYTHLYLYKMNDEGNYVAVNNGTIQISAIDTSSYPSYPSSIKEHSWKIPQELIADEGLYIVKAGDSTQGISEPTYFEIVSDDVVCKQISNYNFNVNYGGAGKILGCTVTSATAGVYAFIPLPDNTKNSFDIDVKAIAKSLGVLSEYTNKISLRVSCNYGYMCTKAYSLKGDGNSDEGGGDE